MRRFSLTLTLLSILLFLVVARSAQADDPQPFPPLAGDVRLPPLARGGIGPLGVNGPDPYNTSQYLVGKVAVSVIIAESDGSIDPDTQTWTAAEISQVHQEVIDGVTWWAAREAQADLTFAFDFYDAQPTGYEPTAHPSDFDDWRVEILNDLGYSETDSVAGTFHLNRDAREAHNAKWAFTVWVVKGNTFSDGGWAYSYLTGPYIQMTSNNAGYTLSNMDMVTAHEMGHIFGARDQYAGVETCGTSSGYYEQPTWNIEGSACDQGQSDIMRDPWNAYPGGLLTTWTAAQVGWLDANTNGVIDAIDDDATWSNLISVTVEIGQSTDALSLARNTGGSTWSEAGLHRLAHTGGRSFGMPDRSYLPTSGKTRYAPGESYTWNFSLTAPTTAGVYTGTWQMINEETHTFGQPLTVTVTAIAGTLTGVVWHDRDGDGGQDAGEPGLPGSVIELSTGVTATTDAGGVYTFTNLASGSYVLTQTNPAGYPYDSTANRFTLVVTAGETSAADFGDMAPLTVAGRLWLDQDDDGVYDAGESPVTGTVQALNGNGTTVVTETVTLADGTYSLAVPPHAGLVVRAVPGGDYISSRTHDTTGYPAGGTMTANFPAQEQPTYRVYLPIRVLSKSGLHSD